MQLSDFMTSDGLLTIAPFDHRSSLATSLKLDLMNDANKESFAHLKRLFMQTLSPVVSAVLTDPEFGPSTVSLKAPSTQVFFSLEESGYSGDHDAMTTLKANWGIDGIKAHNAGAKLLVYTNPKSSTYQQKIALVASLATEAKDKGVVFLVEPVMYALPNETQWQTEGDAGWIATHMEVCRAIAPHTDILKIQYPGSAEACREVSTLHPHWILLSRGVTFDIFTGYLNTARSAGACGYAAGRAIWQELTTLPEEKWEEFLRTVSVPRLEQLNALLRSTPVQQ